MAIYYANVASFSRGKGHSSVAAAAYRGQLVIDDPFTGLTHDYRRRRGVVSVDQLAPEKAPSWCRDASRFWQENERAEVRANARLAFELVVAIPAELGAIQRHALANDLGQLLVERYSVAVLVAVHAPDKKGDERNHHCHLLMSARKVGEGGLGGRACSEFDARNGAGPDAVRALREAVSNRINEHLEKAGHSERVDHRRLDEQAAHAQAQGEIGLAAVLTRQPTQHEGKTVTAMRRRGESTPIAEHNDRVGLTNQSELQKLLSRLESAGISDRSLESNARPTASSDAHAKPNVVRSTRHAKPLRTGSSAHLVGGSVRLIRATGNSKDSHYANERLAQQEAVLREWREVTRDYLRNIEHSVSEMMTILARILELTNQASFERYGHRAEFRAMTCELGKATQRAIRDDSRWTRRLKAEEGAKHKVNDAQCRLDDFDQENPKPRRPLSRRQWGERRRKREMWLERKREQHRRAHEATGPEAQDLYRRKSRDTEQKLEELVDKFAHKFPAEIITGGDESKKGGVPVLKLTPKPTRLPHDAPSQNDSAPETEEERLLREAGVVTPRKLRGPKL